VNDRVGPVLRASELGRAVVSAILELNPGAEIIDRGAYYRVLVAGRCSLTRQAVERIIGSAFVLPGDLERLMPSFAGRLSVGASEVHWTHEVT
jgi:MmoB/DmpM family protein